MSDAAMDQSTGVTIPYASAKVLLRTKETLREKDHIDCLFLKHLLRE